MHRCPEELYYSIHKGYCEQVYLVPGCAPILHSSRNMINSTKSADELNDYEYRVDEWMPTATETTIMQESTPIYNIDDNGMYNITIPYSRETS